MGQPNNPQAQIAELAAAVAALQSAFGQAVPRLTAVEEKLATAEPRFARLESAAQGFDSRVGTLETALAQLQAAATAIGQRMTELEAAAQAISGRLDTMGQVVRPGRTVMRQKVDDLQAMVAEILTRLPEAPPEEGGGNPA